MAGIPEFQLPNNGMPADLAALLFFEWVEVLAAEQFGITSTGSGDDGQGGHTFSFGDVSANHFVLGADKTWRNWKLVSNTGMPEEGIRAEVQEALERTAARDTGSTVVYYFEMRSAAPALEAGWELSLMQQLGDQVPITGRRRLTDCVVLEFIHDPPVVPGAPLLFVPETKIRVFLFVPGPIAGELTKKTAAGMAEIVAAVCTFAMGRVVNVPFMAATFPADTEVAAEGLALRHDPSIGGLARDSVSLDLFGELVALGDMDAFFRVRGALLSYQSALSQANADVATMLFVSAIEALIAPRQEWGKEKVTKRFIKGVQQLCPDTVKTLLDHANLEQALGCELPTKPSKRRYDMLDRIYSLRSVPTHTGIGLSGSAALMTLGSSESIRVALLSELTRGAILGYLQAPRSFLIGHPLIDSPNPCTS